MKEFKLQKDIITIHPFKSYRRKNDLTIQELASKMGVSGGGLSHIENGNTQCSIRFAKAFEKVSGVLWGQVVLLEPEQFRRPVEPRGRIRRTKKAGRNAKS